MSKQKPNIVVLMSDQQRIDTVSAYGLNDVCKTPNIDKLAQRGMRFDRAFTPTAICSPARASFFTGLYPNHHGVTGNGLTINDGVRGLNNYLEEAGYACGYAGKWHVDQKRGPSDFGFEGKDFLGYAFPGSKVLPGLQFGAAPIGRPNHYEEYLKERGFDRRSHPRLRIPQHPGQTLLPLGQLLGTTQPQPRTRTLFFNVQPQRHTRTSQLLRNL
jgi:arylsulfatase A-like enzyme